MSLFEGYRPRGKWIDKIDPRTKLFWMIFVLMIAFMKSNYVVLLVLLGIIVAASLLAGNTLRSMFPSFLVLGVISLQLLVIQLLFCGEGYVLFSVGPMDIYSQAFPLAAQASLQLSIIMLVGMQFLSWTPPEGIILTLVKIKVPYRFAMLVGLAMRFLPLMERELKGVFEIQRARGLQMESIREKLRNLIPVLMPFLFRAFRRANDTALAMELRGFGYSNTRTFLNELRFGRLDAAVITGMVSTLALLISASLLN